MLDKNPMLALFFDLNMEGHPLEVQIEKVEDPET
jgi:hypothetical protein